MENSSETKQNSPELIHGYFLLIFNFIFYSIPLHIWNNKYKYLILINGKRFSATALFRPFYDPDSSEVHL